MDEKTQKAAPDSKISQTLSAHSPRSGKHSHDSPPWTSTELLNPNRNDVPLVIIIFFFKFGVVVRNGTAVLTKESGDVASNEAKASHRNAAATSETAPQELEAHGVLTTQAAAPRGARPLLFLFPTQHLPPCPPQTKAPRGAGSLHLALPARRPATLPSAGCLC